MLGTDLRFQVDVASPHVSGTGTSQDPALKLSAQPAGSRARSSIDRLIPTFPIASCTARAASCPSRDNTVSTRWQALDDPDEQFDGARITSRTLCDAWKHSGIKLPVDLRMEKRHQAKKEHIQPRTKKFLTLHLSCPSMSTNSIPHARRKTDPAESPSAPAVCNPFRCSPRFGYNNLCGTNGSQLKLHAPKYGPGPDWAISHDACKADMCRVSHRVRAIMEQVGEEGCRMPLHTGP